MIGRKFKTPFTSEQGLPCNCVYVMEMLEPEKQFFLSISQEKYNVVIRYSDQGGIPISKIRKLFPESIHEIKVDINKGLDLFEAMEVATNLGITKE